MNEDQYTPYPDISDVLIQKLQSRLNPADQVPSKPGAIDPYKMMLNKNHPINREDVVPGEIQQQQQIVKWPEADIKRLQDYCDKMGIVGFKCGSMNPIAALGLLKNQYGDDYTGVPLENRVPEGYEKMGTSSNKYNKHHTYSQMMKKPAKQILHD